MTSVTDWRALLRQQAASSSNGKLTSQDLLSLRTGLDQLCLLLKAALIVPTAARPSSSSLELQELNDLAGCLRFILQLWSHSY